MIEIKGLQGNAQNIAGEYAERFKVPALEDPLEVFLEAMGELSDPKAVLLRAYRLGGINLRPETPPSLQIDVIHDKSETAGMNLQATEIGIMSKIVGLRVKINKAGEVLLKVLSAETGIVGSRSEKDSSGIDRTVLNYPLKKPSLILPSVQNINITDDPEKWLEQEIQAMKSGSCVALQQRIGSIPTHVTLALIR